MAFSWQLSLSLTKYILTNKVRGRKRFPLVLMLTPTYRCNLACAGCGHIREYRDILDQALTTEECLASVYEANAPVVSITGGEPLLHPEIGEMVEKIVAGRRFVHVCTNGLLLEKSLEKFKPSPYLSFDLHLDSLAESHDRFAGRKGVFDTVVKALRAAKKRGFQVLINTTFYKETDPEEIEALYVMLSEIPVDGIMVSPAFSYGAVQNDVFMSREEIVSTFKPIYKLRKRFPFFNTPVYWEFLAGKKELSCTPWSAPTRNPMGWKKPCYLITDGHYNSFSELMEKTEWERYGVGKDPRCANCMVHCGFEGSALEAIGSNLSDLWQAAKWSMR
jgi:hopanoid biosynthesis associated radical SAM protein HpnH